MVESTAVSCIHPDKYNNSVDRIISKEEEREDPRRDTSVFFEYSGVSTFYKISSNTVYSTVFPHAIQQLQDILHTELILLQEILQLQGSSTINSSKSNGIFKGSIHYISIRTNSTNSRQVLQSISNSTNKN